MRKLKLNKRGLQDLLFFSVIIFIIAIIVIVAGRLNDDLDTHYTNSDASNISKEITSDTFDRFYGIFDWLFLTIFVVFALTIFASVFLLDTHPVFFFIVVIILAFCLIVFAVIGNAYDSFSQHQDVSSQVDNLTIMDTIMDNWVIMLMVVGFIAIVLLFAKIQYR